jgi:hypothetical protein
LTIWDIFKAGIVDTMISEPSFKRFEIIQGSPSPETAFSVLDLNLMDAHKLLMPCR